MPRRDDITKVDLLLPADVWRRVSRLARARKLAALLRLRLRDVLASKSEFERVALRSTGVAEAVGHRWSVELLRTDAEDLDARLAAMDSANRPARSWFLTELTREVGDSTR